MPLKRDEAMVESDPVETAPILGECKPGWEPVRDAFVANFRSHGEIGAGVCITLHGETVVRLAGGWADRARSRPWGLDTLSVVFSTTKGAVATCANLLIDRGELALHKPVSHYWPGFAQNGKGDVTVAMLLDHSAGVPGFREPIKPDAYLDWDYMVRALEQEAPFWEPGTRHGYHMISFGWTVGELVRRVSGQSLADFFRSALGDPLGLDFWIGLPEALEPRVAPIIPSVPDPDNPIILDLYRNAIENPGSLAARAALNMGGWSTMAVDPDEGIGLVDTRRYHAAQIGGAGGIASAAGIAGLYTPLANGALISAPHVRRMSRVHTSTHQDFTLLIPTRFGLGYMKSLDNRHRPNGIHQSMILGEQAFGHPGAGGSLGFADPSIGMAFGYHMNQMGPSVLLDIRAQSLVDAAYACAGAPLDRLPV